MPRHARSITPVSTRITPAGQPEPDAFALARLYRKWVDACQIRDEAERIIEFTSRAIRSDLNELTEGLAVLVDPDNPGKIVVLVGDGDGGFDVHDIKPHTLKP